jgi:hypothetical protein
MVDHDRDRQLMGEPGSTVGDTDIMGGVNTQPSDSAVLGAGDSADEESVMGSSRRRLRRGGDHGHRGRLVGRQGRDGHSGANHPIAALRPAASPPLPRPEVMILRFATDLTVVFTNNQAERDARPVKVQQRTSGGCWRTLDGLADFAVVHSCPSTATKWGPGRTSSTCSVNCSPPAPGCPGPRTRLNSPRSPWRAARSGLKMGVRPPVDVVVA